MMKPKVVRNYLRQLCKNSFQLLKLYLKWSSYTFQAHQKLKNTELIHFIWVQRMMNVTRPLLLVINQVHSSYISQRWFQQSIVQDSMLSVEFSQVQLLLVKKFISWVQTTNSVRNMITSHKTFKEQSLWCQLRLNKSMMSHAVTQLV